MNVLAEAWTLSDLYIIHFFNVRSRQRYIMAGKMFEKFCSKKRKIEQSKLSQHHIYNVQYKKSLFFLFNN